MTTEKTVQVKVWAYQSDGFISTEWLNPREASDMILGTNPDSLISVHHRPSTECVDMGEGGQRLAVGEDCNVIITIYDEKHWKK